MRALIRSDEVYLEKDWTEWTKLHLDWEIEINGWTLVEDYQPEIE